MGTSRPKIDLARWKRRKKGTETESGWKRQKGGKKGKILRKGGGWELSGKWCGVTSERG